jgi:mannonate dehydratase
VDRIRIGKGIGDIDESTLRFFKQIGVEDVHMPTRWNERAGSTPTVRPHVPPTAKGPSGAIGKPWDLAELKRIKERIAEFELDATVAGLGLSANLLMGLEGREADADVQRARIEAAGEVGIEVLTYSFTALRASEGYGSVDGGGRGGADLRDFDYDRIKDLPPYDSVGTISNAQMWENLHWFLEALLPTAESAGVKLAAHPNDPPVPEYRGVAQPLGDYEGWKKLIDLVDSPSNTMFFDTGVTTELGHDAVEAIHYFGSRNRIGTVHFRNVKVTTPRYKYLETFHDDGDADLNACMQAFFDVGYEGQIDPDHTPGLLNDEAGTRVGWAFCIGQMVGMRNGTRGKSGSRQ